MKSATLTQKPGSVAQALQTTSPRALSWLMRFLHGSWLGHPLHVASIELPIGAFTVASILDSRGPQYEAGADAAVGIGVVSAAFAATAGLADWSQTDQPARKIGVFHALLNGSATLCYLVSWILRKQGARKSAVATGYGGWALLMAGAYLGGAMVYRHGVGVDHAQRNGPSRFVPVLDENELEENQPQRVEHNGVGIVLIKQAGVVYALGEKCAHLGGPLSEGTVGAQSIKCPWHGSTYNLQTGNVLEGPSAYPQPCFQVRIQNGQIEVKASDPQRS